MRAAGEHVDTTAFLIGGDVLQLVFFFHVCCCPLWCAAHIPGNAVRPRQEDQLPNSIGLTDGVVATTSFIKPISLLNAATFWY